MATCYFGLNDFTNSRKYFVSCVDSIQVNAIEKIFKDKHLNKPSPKTALILSIILPGLGQFYIGDYREGINSFVLSMGLLFLAVETAVVYSLFDAVISVVPWYQRYFMGGYNNAENLAKIKLQNNRNEVYNKLLKVVEMDKNGNK